MLGISPAQLPNFALLVLYAKKGAHTDCYTCRVDASMNLLDFIMVFYNTPLFKLERQLLKLVGKPSSDLDVKDLAANQTDTFAAWSVEAREKDQILLRDYQGKTRSWLMVSKESTGTRLYFGSAVIAQKDSGEIGRGFKLLMGFHKLYSILLLYSAKKALEDNEDFSNQR